MNIALHLAKIKSFKGESYSFQNADIEMDKSASIAINENSALLFNCSWLKNDPSASTLLIRKGASLKVNSNVIFIRTCAKQYSCTLENDRIVLFDIKT